MWSSDFLALPHPATLDLRTGGLGLNQLALCPWASHFASLDLIFLIGVMREGGLDTLDSNVLCTSNTHCSHECD